ncbi:hypothetical protein SAMN06272771_6988 [Streptomyces sp. Ag82_O1-12]|nr:hypothetical protein SAMN06272771_6988 [Streptomyces sp. Ag82_O1-12]SOD49511.1 hypothetical protein SAMN06272727_6994 [Streptomyces sp. Ag82_G6-1]
MTTCCREDGRQQALSERDLRDHGRDRTRAREFVTQEQDPRGDASRDAFTRAPAILIHPIYRTIHINRFGSRV